MSLRKSSIPEVKSLFERLHAYAGVSSTATYVFALEDQGKLLAAFTWQPPAVGGAKNVCPEMPQAVLMLSRMVAVPKEQRAHLSQTGGRHLSKLLRQQERLIDRTRFPVLVTYSDEGLNHDGYTYRCAGWEPTQRTLVTQYVDSKGRRTSAYQSGKTTTKGLTKIGQAWIQRWESWACPKGQAAEWMRKHGWVREPIPGKVWKSGNQAFRYVRR